MTNENFEGNVSKQEEEGETVTITVTGPETKDVIAQTDADGNFTATFTGLPGNYSAVANIAADDLYEAATSDPFLFTLPLGARTITLTGTTA